MSKIIFERAQKYVNKVLYLYSVMDQVQGLSEKGCSMYKKARYKRHDVLYRYRESSSYTVFMRRSYDDIWRTSLTYYYIDGTARNSMTDSDRKIMKISEFSEDLDFQLSTLYDNNELLNYYIQCLLYTSGFRGFVKIGLSHNTLNALIRHAEDMYNSRDKLWRDIPKDSTIFNW